MKTQTIQTRAEQDLRHPLNVTHEASPFGCCNYFDPCADGIMSLHYSGRLPLLDWMGFNVSDDCVRVLEFLSFVRPARALNGTPTPGYIADPCDDPAGVEFGTCKLTYENFGRIGRHGPTRDIMQPKRYCKTRPVVRLDGSIVADEREWDMKFVTDAVLQEINKLVITGNKGTPGQFDGLERWVKTGYQCSMLDSIVIDWNGNPMTGGNGITWNGQPVSNIYNFIDVLQAAFRRIMQRKMWAPMLANQAFSAGDLIMLMPTQVIQCLLDFFTCWSVCTGAQYNPVVLQSYEARNFRKGLMGGLFGFGQIDLDGVTIPLLGYDWELIKGPKTADIYFLTGAVGGMRIWEGEHINGQNALNELAEGNAGYWTTDGGRMLWKVDVENECREIKGWMHPRLFCSAPFLQIRFQDVQCDQPGGFMSPDPDETSFFPLTSFSQALCP